MTDINFHTVQTIVRRELRDSMRDWRIIIPIFILTIIFPAIMNVTALLIFDFLERYGATLIGERMIPFGLMIVGFFPITFSLVIALETFVGEKERFSLEALFATPASDLELYLGKLFSSLALPLLAAYVGIGVYLTSIKLTDLIELPTSLLVQIVLLTTLEGLVMVSGAVIISSHTTSVRAANLLASFIIIPAALLVQVEAVMMFWGAYDALWYIALGLLVVDVILVRAGMRTFSREEILSRELDTLNLRRIAQQLRRFWIAPPDQVRRAARTSDPLPAWSLLRVYREDLPQLLRSGSLALAASALVMVGGFVLGWLFAAQFPLPSEMFRLDEVASTVERGRLADAAPGWSLLPKFTPRAIFIHNLRAIILSVTFAIFSFGSLSLLLLGLPLSIVGFLAAQIGRVGESPWQFLLAFIVPHGIVELPATLIATAFALRLGAMLIAPPQRLSAGEALLLGLSDFAKVLIFLVLPLLLLAAIIEVYVTPQVIQWLY